MSQPSDTGSIRSTRSRQSVRDGGAAAGKLLSLLFLFCYTGMVDIVDASEELLGTPHSVRSRSTAGANFILLPRDIVIILVTICNVFIGLFSYKPRTYSSFESRGHSRFRFALCEH